MPIITISRGSYCRGKEVALALAKELDYECISREVLHEACDEFDISEIKLVKALQDTPSLLSLFNRSQDRYVTYFKSSLLNHMLQGNIVYHGLIGHFFLQDISHVFKVRINAEPDPERHAKMLAENHREEDAYYYLQDDNEEQRRKNLHLYGKDTQDASLYDLVINMKNLTTADCVDLLATAIRKKQFQETKHSLSKLKGMAFKAKIQAFLSPISPHAKVRIAADYSKVEISHIDGLLKSEKRLRKGLAKRLQKELKIDEVIFKEPTKAAKGHINTFYNLDV